MPKKEQKLKPDTVVKNYWRDNGQFADFFNAVLFGGRQVIKPEELIDADTEESSVLEHREYAESIQAARDTIKIRKKSLVQIMDFARKEKRVCGQYLKKHGQKAAQKAVQKAVRKASLRLALNLAFPNMIFWSGYRTG